MKNHAFCLFKKALLVLLLAMNEVSQVKCDCFFLFKHSITVFSPEWV